MDRSNQTTSAQIEKLENKSNEIEQIVSIIAGFSDQTNLEKREGVIS
ncbi:hypothetical protein [Anaerobacillus arseniciselenatis]|nr:hypothetical protein [Anaerobacillus arseniciselenatis]